MAGINRLAASGWLVSLGDTAQSARLLTWHEAVLAPEFRWLDYAAVLAPLASLEKARIANAQGDRDRARPYYARFLESYDMPVPALHHLVAEAQAAVSGAGVSDQL